MIRRNQKPPKLETEPKTNILSNEAHALPSKNEFDAIPTDIKGGSYTPMPLEGRDEQGGLVDGVAKYEELIGTKTERTADIMSLGGPAISAYMNGDNELVENLLPSNTANIDTPTTAIVTSIKEARTQGSFQERRREFTQSQ